MPALSSLLSNAVEKLLFCPVTVVDSEMIGGRFRLVRLQGEGLQGVKWKPGQAIYLYLGSLTKRVYTPMDVDSETGSASFLFYLHGSGPGSRWAATLTTGDICHVMRPKDSLDFTTVEDAAIFFGDETSFAAAQALHVYSRKAAHRYVFEVSSIDAAQAVVSKLSLDRVTLIPTTKDESHLDIVLAKLAEHAAAIRSPQWVFTGKALSIQTLRKRLKAKGVALQASRVRAYWSPGKTGME